MSEQHKETFVKPNRGTIYNWMFQQFGTSHRWVIVGTENIAGERYIRTSLIVKLELDSKTGDGPGRDT